MSKKLIYVSEISILIGKLNKNLVRTFENVLKRVDKKYIDDVKEKLEKNKEEIKNDKDEEQKKRMEEMMNDSYDRLILTKESYIEKNIGSDNMREILEINKNNIKEKKEYILKTIKNEEIKEMTESLINANYGAMSEGTALDIYEKMQQTKVIRRQEGAIKNVRDEYYIYGRIDGIQEKDNSVIEVKNRVNNLFMSLREYEKVQIQLYMYLMGLENGKLVEKYKDEINIIEVKLDIEYIENILKKINRFIDKLDIFLKNEEIRDNYMKLINEKDKENYLHNYYLLEIKKI